MGNQQRIFKNGMCETFILYLLLFYFMIKMMMHELHDECCLNGGRKAACCALLLYIVSVFILWLGMQVVKLGGPVYRIGVGGGSASSVEVRDFFFESKFENFV